MSQTNLQPSKTEKDTSLFGFDENCLSELSSEQEAVTTEPDGMVVELNV